ncbi:hypothetical protein BH10PSE9_BH10PSE9_10090 [soil metagenome]
MYAILLFLHFVGLMIGAAGGLGGAILGRRALSMPPEQAQTVRSLGPFLANVAAVGVVVLWLSGLALVWMRGGFGDLPSLFWVKFAFVIAVTVLVGLVHMTYAELRRTKNPAVAGRLAILGPLTGLANLIVVLTACFAFL